MAQYHAPHIVRDYAILGDVFELLELYDALLSLEPEDPIYPQGNMTFDNIKGFLRAWRILRVDKDRIMPHQIEEILKLNDLVIRLLKHVFIGDLFQNLGQLCWTTEGLRRSFEGISDRQRD